MVIFKSNPEDKGNYFQVILVIVQDGTEQEIDFSKLPKADKLPYKLTVQKLSNEGNIIEHEVYKIEGIGEDDFLLKLWGHLEWTKGNYRDRESNWRYYQGEGMAFLGTTMQLDYFDNREGETAWGISCHRHEEPEQSSSQKPEHIKLVKIFSIYNHDTGESFNRKGTTLIPYELEPGGSDERSYWEYLEDLRSSN